MVDHIRSFKRRPDLTKSNKYVTHCSDGQRFLLSVFILWFSCYASDIFFFFFWIAE